MGLEGMSEVRAADAPTGVTISRTGLDDGTPFRFGNYFSDLLVFCI